MTPLLAAYAAAGRAASPALALWLQVRAARGKEDRRRLAERWGFAGRPRPAGRLIWMHAASIGESVSILPVIARLAEGPAPVRVLLTTITRSSAELMEQRLPADALHAYAPLDTATALDRFLAHWRPDATVVVEQELWPLLLAKSPRPRLLVNARLSARSARRWRRVAPAARWLLGRFDRVLAQSAQDAKRLAALGAVVETPGNLKAASPPLPADHAALAALRRAVQGRPVWIAASTHAPEERWLAAADLELRRDHPDLLTVIVPRHPARATRIAEELARADLRLRSATPLPDRDTGIYLVDAFGELGLFYRLAAFAFIGGSLVPHGGQNPLEAARLGRPVLFGPHMSNFEELAGALRAAGGADEVQRAELPRRASAWLADATACAAAGDAAQRCVEAMGDAAVARTCAAIREALERA